MIFVSSENIRPPHRTNRTVIDLAPGALAGDDNATSYPREEDASGARRVALNRGRRRTVHSSVG